MSNTTVTVVTETDDATTTLTGTLLDVEIFTENAYEYFGRSNCFARSNTRHFIKGEFVDEYQIKVDKKSPEKPRELTTVIRTAVVEARDRTSVAFEEARKLVGAPGNAKIRVGSTWQNPGEFVIEDLNNPSPVQVEFRWKDKV